MNLNNNDSFEFVVTNRSIEKYLYIQIKKKASEATMKNEGNGFPYKFLRFSFGIDLTNKKRKENKTK